MSFGSLKTLKLERTLGDAVLSITKQVPTDADEQVEFNSLDELIIKSASNLREFTPSEVTKAEGKPSTYPTIGKAEQAKEEVKEEVKEVETKPKKRAGRPKGSTTKKKTEVKEEVKPTLKPVKEEKPELASQDEKTKLVETFQATFESDIGYTNDDTYEAEFNEFLKSLISMDYKSFLEAEITIPQLKTFRDLI